MRVGAAPHHHNQVLHAPPLLISASGDYAAQRLQRVHLKRVSKRRIRVNPVLYLKTFTGNGVTGVPSHGGMPPAQKRRTLSPIEFRRHQQLMGSGSRPITAKRGSDNSHLRIQLLPRLRSVLYQFSQPLHITDPTSNNPRGMGRPDTGTVPKADEALSRHQESLGRICCIPHNLSRGGLASKRGRGRRGRRRIRNPEEIHDALI